MDSEGDKIEFTWVFGPWRPPAKGRREQEATMKFAVECALSTLLGGCDKIGKCSRFYGDLNVPETEQGIALILEWWIASVEKPANIDRKWILSTYVRCLAAVRSEQVVVEPYGL